MKFSFPTNVSGLSHSDYFRSQNDLQVGDSLTVEARPNNQFDSQAVAVMQGSRHIGWIPAKYANKPVIFAALMAKLPVQAKVTSHDLREPTYNRLYILVWLDETDGKEFKEEKDITVIFS